MNADKKHLFIFIFFQNNIFDFVSFSCWWGVRSSRWDCAFLAFLTPSSSVSFSLSAFQLPYKGKRIIRDEDQGKIRRWAEVCFLTSTFGTTTTTHIPTIFSCIYPSNQTNGGFSRPTVFLPRPSHLKNRRVASVWGFFCFPSLFHLSQSKHWEIAVCRLLHWQRERERDGVYNHNHNNNNNNEAGIAGATAGASEGTWSKAREEVE